MIDFIIGALILVALIFAVRSIKKKKSIGCCGGCAGCPSAKACNVDSGQSPNVFEAFEDEAKKTEE